MAELLMGRVLIISRPLYDLLVKHLQEVYPEEGCGIVAGRDGVAQQVIPVENLLHSRTAYEMDPRQQIEAMLAIETAGMEMVAIFHSHPNGPAEPSATDMAQAYYPDALQLIVSFARPEAPEAGLFVVADGRVAATTLIIE